MRAIHLLLLVAAAFFVVSCGADINPEPCKTYCQKMQDLRAFGSFDCLAMVQRDVNNFCAARPIVEPDDLQTPPTQTDWDAPYCFLDGQIPDDFVKPSSASWYAVNNPAGYDTCIAQCEVNTNGDGIPAEMEADLAGASTVYDFLQAQLDQQCRVEAEEQ